MFKAERVGERLDGVRQANWPREFLPARLGAQGIEVDDKSFAIRQGCNRVIPKAGAAEPGMQHDNWITIAAPCGFMPLVAQLLSLDRDSI